MAECACETCIYRKNCQFLGKYKKAVVVDCEAYESEADLKTEVAKEIFDALDEYIKTLRTESQKRIKYDDTDYYKGKVVASDEVAWFIRTVLEKKYLEERV